ncbi:UNC93-like protein MFSD11 isoform X1 [Stegostoma tigrinum]|uniref:UNC93-like protein MFSD11 isoform X1 n=2 Tax=Stegostoma tigrinum TaxID=3053191 RepID=UPI00202B5ACD|nr:UNC93-like protein MFSD11 isoform X1 [Stegostoma tigrinum]
MGDRKVINVYLLGFAFMLIFTAFTTCGNIEQTVIRSLTNSSFSGSGYNSLAIIYGVFSASNLIAPSVVAVVGPKMSMVFSGVVYSGYVVSFSKPMLWSFYITSILIGFAAAVLWTAQGNFLILNSDCTNINRNTGTFWALLQSSMLFGNLYVYLQWRDTTTISDHDRSTLFIVLFVISLAGTVILLALKSTKNVDHYSEINDPLLLDPRPFKEKVMSTLDQITSEFRSMLRVFCTKNMVLLSIPIAYSGLVLTFYSGVYGTCIGATRQFGTMAKGLIGLSGIFIGIGEILGGGIFGLLCINNQFRRTSTILLGVIVHFLAFYLIFLIIPGDAPVGDATSARYEPYLFPSPSAALVSSFLLGLGDSCFNTQLYSILGILYAQQSGPAFAIFKFVQSISAAVAFGYSNYLVLPSQLLILTAFCFIGTLSFFIVEKIEDNASGLQDF